MKSIDLLCASPASTAICSSTDLRAMVRSHGTRSVDRPRHHYVSDHFPPKSKSNILPVIPCSSQLPIIPTSYYQKSRKSASDYSSASRSDRELRRKSSTDIINDLTTSPYGSSRHLLSHQPFNEMLPQTDNYRLALVPSEPVKTTKNDSALVPGNQALRPRQKMNSNDSLVLKSITKQKQLAVSQPVRRNEPSVLKSSSARSRSRHQVVELMVSIHCKGCEGKVRKHISRMEGVTSFSIDRATKKVIVIGEVTPLGVLSSISKVKNAQFWPCPTSLSSS
ncbi:Sodium potassium root defective [Heracleum sosnowskyi]|uniref:Sodium potassium root defective n=1 Tax=Heracleum sosnowskyi TaxID=360622 RepID=A0AAD8N8I9_9APIA|nr:Sodium potassium root defective [Heracleum sosnowskyi]